MPGMSVKGGSGYALSTTASATATAPQIGNTCIVDAVFGNDATATRNGLPFLTVAAALAAAVSGDVVIVNPGVYNLAAGITLPSGVSLSSYNHLNTTLQMLNVVADTTLVTMGSGTSIENVTLLLTSTQHHTLKGIAFPGTTSATALVEGVDLTVNNATAGDAGTSNVYGIHSFGTGVPLDAYNALVAVSVSVLSAGLGNKRGILVDTNAHTFGAGTVYLVVLRTGAAAGSYIGEEVNFAGAVLNHRLGTVSGLPTADVSQTSGRLTLGTPLLVNHTANGRSFETVANAPVYAWGDPGASPAGVTYMYLGTANATATMHPFLQLAPALMLNLTVRAATGPGGARVDRYDLCTGVPAVNTGLFVTLTGAQVVATSTISVTIPANTLISLQRTIAAGSGTANDQVTVSYV